MWYYQNNNYADVEIWHFRKKQDQTLLWTCVAGAH